MSDAPRKYESEAALCAAFNVWALSEGWTPYPETAGWDVLLVAADGTQIGVQAKLKFNLKVIAQTLPEFWTQWYDAQGPDFRAVLVPERDGVADSICGALGLQLFYDFGARSSFAPGLKRAEHNNGGWHYWNPPKRHPLPEFVPDVAAGVSGPVQLTEWKIKALRIAAVLELRGHVTREDFKRYGLDHRRWTGPGGWLVAAAIPGQWKSADGAPLFAADHPVVYPQVLDAVRAELAGVPADGKQKRLVA